MLLDDTQPSDLVHEVQYQQTQRVPHLYKGTYMLYTKAIVKGYTTKECDEFMVKIELNCLMTDKDLDAFLEPLREQFNEMGDPLHFKMVLEAQDI